MYRIPTTIIVFMLITLCASAAPMARVTAIKDGRTLLVDGGAELRLAGVEITNDLAARELLRWTVGSAWVMVERTADGGALVYRSPDAMFINRELVLRGYARATLPGIEPEQRAAATYLGIADPGPRPAASGVSAPASRSGSGTSRRSSAPRASRPRSSPSGGPRRR